MHFARTLLACAAALTLLSGPARATLFSGTVYGQVQEGPVKMAFDLDPHRPMTLQSTDGVMQAHYTVDPNGPPFLRVWLPDVGSPFGNYLQSGGMFDHVDLYDVDGQQSIDLSFGYPHIGGLGIHLTGPGHAFFSDLDVTTLHPGPIDLTHTSGYIGVQWLSAQMRVLSVQFAAPVPELSPPMVLGSGLLILLGVFRLRRRGATASVPKLSLMGVPYLA